MTQNLTYIPDIRSVLEQVSGCCVPDQVCVDGFADSFGSMPIDNIPDGLGGFYRCSAGSEQQCLSVCFPEHMPQLQIIFQNFDGFLSDRHIPLFASFTSRNEDEKSIKINIRNCESNKLGRSHACVVKNGNNEPISYAGESVGGCSFDKHGHLGFGEPVRYALGSAAACGDVFMSLVINDPILIHSFIKSSNNSEVIINGVC